MRLRVAAQRRAKADQFSCGYICCSLCHWRLLLVLGNKPRGCFPVAWSHGVLSIFFPCLIPCQYIWNPCLICCESVVPCGSHMALLCISACPGGEYERDRSLFRAGLRLHAQPRPLLTKWFVRKHRAHTTGSSLKNGAAWERKMHPFAPKSCCECGDHCGLHNRLPPNHSVRSLRSCMHATTARVY